MIVSTRHRLLLACAAVLVAQAALADSPPALHGARMANNPRSSYTVLFGGATALDSGTRLTYDLAATWAWNGERWFHLYPAHSPSGRALHAFVYDRAANRFVLFGGRRAAEDLNDTWLFDGADWSEVTTSTAPSPRLAPGAAYDRARDKTVLFGGSHVFPTSATSTATTTTKYYDTWEFDGKDWKQTGSNGPAVDTPVLVWDDARRETLLLGADTAQKTLMYRYDPAKGSWTQITPTTLPDCAVSADLVYQESDQKVVLFGGTCALSDTIGTTWEWDGTDWTKVTTTILRLSGETMAYDEVREVTLMFGGTVAFGSQQSGTFVYRAQAWTTAVNLIAPGHRSLSGFRTNGDGSVWLYSGLSENGNLDDFWSYARGAWTVLSLDAGPVSCISPATAYDSDRRKLVVLCSDINIYEYDGTKWGQITGLKTNPPTRRFSSMVYDPSLKKAVMFGGYDDLIAGYLDETWTWDGSAWSRQKNKPAPRRSLAAMWYDPVLKKTVMFGGIGQSSKDARIERFNDMWSFDGTGWIEIVQGSTVPSPRYGAQVAVDPRTNTVLLFGGLRLDINGAKQTQVYANDTWQWDGAKWTELHPATVPPGRENGGMAFDPAGNELVMFGGWAGYYMADAWAWTGTDWKLRSETIPTVAIPVPRRRGTGR